MTAPILVAGEALYDLVADAAGAVSGHPGGGPFNTARAIGRLRRPVAYLGRLSNDRLGATHEELLAADGVDLRCVTRTSDPTTLALASLDAGGAASWSFYATGTAAAGLTAAEALAALPPHVTALHVGTLGLVLEPLATAIEALVARLAGETMVVVDPNVRTDVIDDPETYRARLERELAHSDLVKVSEEDLAWLDPGRSRAAAARALLERGPRAVLLTRGADGATAITRDADTPIAPVPTEVVDTIGAGDAFGGGFLAWWTSQGLRREDLARHELVVAGARFAAAVAARTVACAGASPPQLPASAAGGPLELASL
ncbi:MAG TPA: PfkB family carbohydrate kinase [Solirubrobacteraceae bacterium]|nr:PfkB family carbohydrate kinase [Solirubrobacteraceae bacterium]